MSADVVSKNMKKCLAEVGLGEFVCGLWMQRLGFKWILAGQARGSDSLDLGEVEAGVQIFGQQLFNRSYVV